MFEILEKAILTPNTKKMVVSAPLVAGKAEPGQFIIVRMHEKGERIPLTIADSDESKGTVTIVFQEVGKSTSELGTYEVGDCVFDFVGPLGVPAELPHEGVVMCVGGGVGTAPMYPKAKALHRAGVRVLSIIGARTADLIIMEDEMRAVSDELFICTDDGSRGFHGFVSQKLEEMIKAKVRMDEVIAIGPLPMMRATAETTRPYGLKTWVSMNPVMVDGTGMCGACRLTVGSETKFCCVDGPMFDGHLVDFREAMRRSQMYLAEEKTAISVYESHKVACSLGGDR